MRGLSPKVHTSSRSKSSCSFCRSPNHQVGVCPHIPIVWESLQQGIIPLDYLSTISDNDHSNTSSHGGWRNNSKWWTSPLKSYYSQGENWGDLFKQASRAYVKYERHQARLQAKKDGKKSAKRSTATQTCGYCGDKGHTRRTCTHLSSLKTDLATANRNFRQWFYREYVEQYGLSTGCIVEFDVKLNGGYNRPSTTHTIKTIVTDVNWDTINLFSQFTKDSVDWRTFNSANLNSGHDRLNNILSFIQSDVLLKIPYSKEKYPNIDLGYYYNSDTAIAIPLPLGKSNDCVMGWESQSRLGYNSPKIENLRIVSRAPQVLADDWIDGYSDEMSVILKKFSKEELDFLGISEYIREWANKTI